MRRAQAAIEFVVLTGFMVMVFTVFFVLVQERAAISQERAHLLEVASVGETVRQEFVLAAQVQPGYSRVFHLPVLIGAQPYSISLYPKDRPSEIVINTTQGQYVIFLEEGMDTGSTVAPGYNQINKTLAGNITLNHLPDYQTPVVRMCLDDQDCVDEMTCTDNICDEAHGTCSFPVNCGAKQECNMDGGCECVAGYTECEDCGQGDSICTMVCVDMQNDPKNCGGCGVLCEDGDSCVAGGCVPASSCTVPGTTDMAYYAGTDGTSWDSTGTDVRSQYAAQGMTACCDIDSQCPWAASVPTCRELGLYAGRVRLCLDTREEQIGTPTFFYCNAQKDVAGSNWIDRDGVRYCCSKFTDPAGNLQPGAVGWGRSTDVPKTEGYPDGGSVEYDAVCSDGSDNDCDGLTDCQEIVDCATSPNCLVCAITPPGQPAASDVSDTSATVSWTLSSSVDVDEQTLFYGTDSVSVSTGCDTEGDCTPVTLDKDATSTDLKSLTPSTEYHLMVRATDTDSGCTPSQADSSLSSFTTLPTETCPMSPAPSGLTYKITFALPIVNVTFNWINSSRTGIDEQILYVGSSSTFVQNGCSGLGTCYHTQTLYPTARNYTWSIIATSYPGGSVYAVVRSVDSNSVCSPNYNNSNVVLVH